MMSTVIHKINAQAVLARSYAFGYAIGNVTGISLERKLAPGFYHFEADYPHPTGKSLADRIRTGGQPVTVFRGQDMRGPADELYMACRRQELKPLLDIAKAEDPNAFYITEMAREVSKSGRSPYFLFNGRRSVLKRR